MSWKATAEKLRDEDANKWTQKRIGDALGVARETVRNWFTSNGQSAKTSNGKPKPDARMKVSQNDQTEIFDRVFSGDARMKR